MEFVVPVAISFLLSTTISLLFPTNTKRTGPKLDDTGIVGSAYGTGIPFVRGRMRCSGNIIWGLPLREQVNTNKQSAGKGQTVTTTSWSYYATFAAMLAQGHNDMRPLRIWAEKKLLWQAPDTSLHLTGDLTGGGTFEFFPGSSTQGRSATIEAALGTSRTPAYRGRCYIVINELPVEQFGKRIPVIEVELACGASTASALVSDILTELCLASGLTSGQIDVADITQEVWGIRVTPGPAGNIIETICAGLGIQVIDTGDKIKFQPIEQELHPVIDADDLLDMGDDRFPIKTLREDALPKTIQVNYIDADRDYQVGTQQQSRQLTRSVNVVSLDAPMVFDAAQAFAVADSALYRAWISKDTYGPFGLGRKYLYLEPGDVIPVQVDGYTHNVRIKKITTGVNGSRKIEGEAYDSAVLTGNTGGDSGAFSSQVIPSLGDTWLRVLDVPAQNDYEAMQVGLRIAATGTGPGWRQGVVEQSVDGGITWSTFAALESYTIMGYCASILPDPPPHVMNTVIDEVSTVTVQLIKGTLQSISDALLIQGQNAMMIGNEEIYFGVATLIAPNQYQLSRLLRGRRGTERYMTGHVADEDATGVASSLFVPMSVSAVGQTRQYRVTPNGGVASPPVAFALVGNSAKCFSPVHVAGTRDVSDNLTITWTRRSRIGTEFMDSGDIPMDEAILQYQVDILDGPDVVRSVIVTSASYVYSAANQVTDFGSAQPAVDVRIAQIGQLVGLGIPATATV